MPGFQKQGKFYFGATAIFLAVFVLSGCSSQTQQTTADQSKVEEAAQPVVESIPESQEQTKDPVVETKEDIKTEPITFETTTQTDSTLANGLTKIKQEGKNGTKELKYKITITDGQETGRDLISETVVVKPVNKVVLIGMKEATTTTNTSGGSCGSGYYKNVDENCIKSPSSDPAGASAKCRDGTYSYSAHRQGTCSSHGGVAQWL